VLHKLGFLLLVLSHHIHFIGPPERADVSKLLHHALQVYVDYSSQHCLKKPANTSTICIDIYSYVIGHIQSLFMTAAQKFYTLNIHDRPTQELKYRVLTFGRSSKSSPIFNKITRITIAETAPAT